MSEVLSHVFTAGGRFKGSHVFTAARRFKGKGKGNRPGYAGAPKGRGQFHGRRTRFDDDDRRRGKSLLIPLGAKSIVRYYFSV